MVQWLVHLLHKQKVGVHFPVVTQVIVPQVFSDFVGDRHTHLINTPPKYYGPGQGRTGRTIDTSPVPPLPHPQFKTSMLCINVYHHTQLLL